MAYEKTAVNVAKSQDQIRKLVLTNNGTGVAFVSQPPQEGFEAMVPIDGKTYNVRISATVKASNSKATGRYYRGVWRPAVDKADAEARRIWRVLFYHMKSVYEATNSGVMEFRELMLPYIVTKDNRTVAEHILPKLDLAIAGRPERMLPAHRDDAE